MRSKLKLIAIMLIVPLMMFSSGLSVYTKADTLEQSGQSQTVDTQTQQTPQSPGDQQPDGGQTPTQAPAAGETGESQNDAAQNPGAAVTPGADGETSQTPTVTPTETPTVTPEETPTVTPEAADEKNAFELESEQSDFVGENYSKELIKSAPAKRTMLRTAASTANVTVDKTAGPVHGARTYEVSLSVTGKQFEKPNDVVIAIDCSGSMDGDSMKNAKAAAISFANNLLDEKPNTNIAVVPFAGSASYYWFSSDWVWDFWPVVGHRENCRYFSNNKDEIAKAINSFEADGGTNIADAFDHAGNLLASQTRDSNKTVVLLSDGVANKYYAYDEDNEPYLTSTYDDWPQSHNEATIAAYNAGQALIGKGYSVFTIGLFNGIRSTKPGKHLSREEIMQTLSIAQNTLTRAAQPGNYYDSPDSTSLNGIYQTIEQNINYSAKNAVITDFISSDVMNNFDIGTLNVTQGTATRAGNQITWNAGTIVGRATLTYKITAHESYEGSNGSPIYTNREATLNYTNLAGVPNQTMTFPMPQITVPAPLRVNAGADQRIGYGEYANLAGSATGGYPGYTAAWTATDNWTGSGMNPSPADCPENSTTYTLTVSDIYGYTKSDSVEVHVIKGQVIIIKKVLDKNGNLISESKEFPINVSGAFTLGLPANRIGSIQWNHFAKGDGSSTIFNTLPIRTYVASEQFVPQGYKLVSIEPSSGVTLTKDKPTGTITITNQVQDKGYFTAEESIDNHFNTAGSIRPLAVGPHGSTAQDMIAYLIQSGDKKKEDQAE